jgi:uncharacterized protein (TIGR03435 family)
MTVFRSVCASCALFSSGVLVFAQTAAKPAFEVASIKASAPLPTLIAQIRSGEVRPGMSVSGNRFDCQMSLDSLIAAAYRVRTSQIVGPDWLSSQRFEIHATIPEDTPKEKVREMLQTLLEERFKLKAHLENKEEAVYALVVSKGGPKLMNADDVSAFYDGAKPITPNAPISVKQDGDSTILIDQRTGTISRSKYRDGVMRMEILKTSMPAFAERLAELVDRPIVDATNLKGSYKMTMDLPMEVYRNAIMNRPVPSDLASLSGATPFSRAAAPAPGTDEPGGTASDPSGKAVLLAVEKLGLKLDPRKAPIEALIIEHLEKNPTEN